SSVWLRSGRQRLPVLQQASARRCSSRPLSTSAYVPSKRPPLLGGGHVAQRILQQDVRSKLARTALGFDKTPSERGDTHAALRPPLRATARIRRCEILQRLGLHGTTCSSMSVTSHCALCGAPTAHPICGCRASRRLAGRDIEGTSLREIHRTD